jgi:predicted CxxxxCH...CXXCH cytochrome family protein
MLIKAVYMDRMYGEVIHEMRQIVSESLRVVRCHSTDASRASTSEWGSTLSGYCEGCHQVTDPALILLIARI